MRQILFVIASLCAVLCNGQEKKLAALRISTPIRIDGNLDEAIWQQAAVADSFIANSPDYGQPCSQKTIVHILYDDQAVYIGAYLYDDPKQVRRQLTSRDGEQRKDIDYFSVFFDTYHDHQNGFQFLVTSRNVQTDGRLLTNPSSLFGPPSDYTWDAVWESNVKMQKDGWSVEMKIPYSAIRFSKKNIQDWGLNFQRYIRRTNESVYWNKVNPNESGFVNQFGNLAGMENIVPPLRLSFLPYITSGFRTVPYANGKTKTDFLRNGGMDVKYGINESFTLDATVIPDFGQVISDNVVLNLSPYEVQFQENRPFFTEGIELFNKAGLFYSRRVGSTPAGYGDVSNLVNSNPNLQIVSNPGITQLLNASKFSGRTKKKLGIAVFNAIGASIHAVVENKITGEKTSIETEPLTNYNILVLDQALRNRSSLTFTNSNVWRSGGKRNANVTGVDVNLFDAGSRHNFSWSGRFSQVTGMDKYNGFSNTVSYSKVSGHLQYQLQNSIVSDKYDPNDLGYLRSPNLVSSLGRISYSVFTPTKHFLSYSYNLSVQPVYLYKPFQFSNVVLQGGGFWYFKNFWDLTVKGTWQPVWQRDYFDLRTPGRVIKKTPYYYLSMVGSNDSRKRFFMRYVFGFGESPLPDDPYFNFELAPRYRFNEHLSLELDVTRDHDHGNFGYAYRDAGGEPIAGRRQSTNLSTVVNGVYNFTSRMNLSLRARHYWSKVIYTNFYNVDADGDLLPRSFESGHDQNFNAFNLDMFYTWDFKYGSKLIIGYKNWLGNDFPISGLNYKNYTSNLSQVFQQPHGNEVTVRLIYYIDYLTLKKKA
ncbi:MAG: DUF5916 domain-containing protein, partial [Sediminibacterium sp.]